MRNPGGYLIGTIPEGGVDEHDTFTCSHCQRLTIVQHKAHPEDMGGMCKICMGLICDRCMDLIAKGNGCMTWEKNMEIQEARSAALRSYGM